MCNRQDWAEVRNSGTGVRKANTELSSAASLGVSARSWIRNREKPRFRPELGYTQLGSQAGPEAAHLAFLIALVHASYSYHSSAVMAD